MPNDSCFGYGPWEVSEELIFADDYYIAAIMSDVPNAKGNAKLIVNAVNAHADLIAALSEMVEVYWGSGDGQEPPPRCIQNAQAAIAKAEAAGDRTASTKTAAGD